LEINQGFTTMQHGQPIIKTCWFTGLPTNNDSLSVIQTVRHTTSNSCEFLNEKNKDGQGW